MVEEQLVEVLTVAVSSRSEGLVCACLFGSHAHGDSRSGSDVDVAVLFEEDPPRALDDLPLDLADELSGALGRPVDLVVLNRAPADLIHRVPRDGLLILDLDPSARMRFEARSRSEYFDLLPFLRRYRRVEGSRSP